MAIGPFVEAHGRVPTCRLVVFVRDRGTDALLLEPLADALRAVGFVGGEFAGFWRRRFFREAMKVTTSDSKQVDSRTWPSP
jgi:hypothetical protein